jgi:hypothetical protein
MTITIERGTRKYHVWMIDNHIGTYQSIEEARAAAKALRNLCRLFHIREA